MPMELLMLRAASHCVVPVRIPFVILIFSGACSIKGAWRLSRCALALPLHQKRNAWLLWIFVEIGEYLALSSFSGS
jgi:hypothetical protein